MDKLQQKIINSKDSFNKLVMGQPCVEWQLHYLLQPSHDDLV